MSDLADLTHDPQRPSPATYTLADLARMLNCSERHVHRLNDRRDIPGLLRFGRLVRFSRKRVDEWLERGSKC